MSTLEASSASFPLKDTRIFHRESTWSFAAVLETASTILHPLVMIVLEVVPAGLLLALIVPMVACFVLAAIILLAVFAVLRLTHHLSLALLQHNLLILDRYRDILQNGPSRSMTLQ